MKGKVFAALALGAGILVFVAFALFYERAPAPSTTPTASAPAPTAPARASAAAPSARGSAELVRPHSPSQGGPASAPVTIVEFLDPECEACRAMYPIVKAVLAEYGDRVHLVIRYMPYHANSMFAASVLEEAREDGKYDEALEALFRAQPEWGSHHAPKPELIPTYLEPLGIDASRLEREAVIAEHGSKIEQDQADGQGLGVRGTPTFFVNGVMLPELGYQPLKQAIEIALAARAPSS